MEKRKQIYEGKAKKVFATDDDHFLIVEYKDDATAFNGLKKGTIAGKGIINNKMSNIFMDRFEQVKQRIDKFNKDRDWDQFHTPSNLSKSISIEANELLECFQWSDTNYNIEEVKEELADVMNYCIQMSLVLNVDIIDIINAKMDKQN